MAGGPQELMVWKKSMELCREVGKILKKLPKKQQFELASQLSCSVQSVPSNIVEGHGRKSTKQYIYFLNVAQGSNNEVQTQLFLCEDMGYLEHKDLKKAIALTYDVARLLHRLIKSLEDKIEQEKEN